MAGNAGNLSELSTARPNSTVEPKSVLDDYHRELRRAAKRSIGLEHYLETGAHKFPSGTDAERPLNPTDGQVFFNTERGALEQWDATTDPDNPKWVRRFLHANQTIHLCGMVPGQRVGIGNAPTIWWSPGGTTEGTFAFVNVLACPGAYAGAATSAKVLAATDVYLYKGTYTVRATAYLAKRVTGAPFFAMLGVSGTAFTNAGTALVQKIGDSGVLGSVTITASSANANAWYDASAEIVVTTPGWYPVTLTGANASNSFLVHANSVLFERTA